MLKQFFIVLSLGSIMLFINNAYAHFLELIPTVDIVKDQREKSVFFDIRFSHPMENGPVMNMDKPTRFIVQHNGKQTDLIDSLKHNPINNKNAYTTIYDIKDPGDFVFGIEPAPYWEPTEQKMIIHYTKVVINAYGAEEGWDEPLRFPVEIDPLVRPYGLWTGNTFRGVVKKKWQASTFYDS